MSCTFHIPAKTNFDNKKDFIKNYLPQKYGRKGREMNGNLDELHSTGMH